MFRSTIAVLLLVMPTAVHAQCNGERGGGLGGGAMATNAFAMQRGGGPASFTAGSSPQVFAMALRQMQQQNRQLQVQMMAMQRQMLQLQQENRRLLAQMQGTGEVGGSQFATATLPADRAGPRAALLASAPSRSK